MKLTKRCGKCQRVHAYIPKNAKPWLDEDTVIDNKKTLLGLLWDCACGNSLFLKASSIDLMDTEDMSRLAKRDNK